MGKNLRTLRLGHFFNVLIKKSMPTLVVVVGVIEIIVEVGKTSATF